MRYTEWQAVKMVLFTCHTVWGASYKGLILQISYFCPVLVMMMIIMIGNWVMGIRGTELSSATTPTIASIVL